MSAKAKGKQVKAKPVKKRLPGKVILPVAVFAVAAIASAVIASLLIGGEDETPAPAAAITLHAPAASIAMPPPLSEDRLHEIVQNTAAGHDTPPEHGDTEHDAAPLLGATAEHTPQPDHGAEQPDDGHQTVATTDHTPIKDLSSTLPLDTAPTEHAALAPEHAPAADDHGAPTDDHSQPAATATHNDPAPNPPTNNDPAHDQPAQDTQLANLPDSAVPSDADAALIERTSQGFLPKVGPDGRQPWQVYARPFDASDDRPRLAVVFTSLGLSSAATEAAIQGLPGGITLAFQPYADDLQQWIRLARAAGHEVLLNLPMEPVDYPSSDPGPQALFTALTPQQNQTRLDWALSRVTGYVGVTSFMGSRFTTSRDAMLPVVQTLKDRGLLLLDSRASARSVATKIATELAVPRAINDRFLDTGEVTRVSIDSRLAEAERIAHEVGTSVVIGQPYPVTIERVRAWAQELESRGIVLAPLSAVVNLQEDR